MIACETARDSFLTILNVVGGPNEKDRASRLLNSITFLPDINDVDENSLWTRNVKLRLGKKIQQRTYKVFTFGMYHKAITVTANKGAAEAAKMQVNLLPMFDLMDTISIFHKNTIVFEVKCRLLKRKTLILIILTRSNDLLAK